MCVRIADPAAINLETVIDRLLPMETSYLLEGYCGLMLHQMGEHATHPIARFAGCLTLLLRLTWNGHAALSRLAIQPAKRTLGYVQSPFLGLNFKGNSYAYTYRN